jgi:hypothetical protein
MHAATMQAQRITMQQTLKSKPVPKPVDSFNFKDCLIFKQSPMTHAKCMGIKTG